MKNNKKNLKQIIYTIIITLMLISLVYVATRDNSMEANNNKYLFMGDAEDDVETNSKIIWEDIDVLKVGHHASDTSSTEQFINKVLPEVAVISVNSNTNSYGHPSEKIIKRLQDKECEIYRTDMNGTILLINENGTNKVQMLDTKVNAGK